MYETYVIIFLVEMKLHSAFIDKVERNCHRDIFGASYKKWELVLLRVM